MGGGFNSGGDDDKSKKRQQKFFDSKNRMPLTLNPESWIGLFEKTFCSWE